MSQCDVGGVHYAPSICETPHTGTVHAFPGTAETGAPGMVVPFGVAMIVFAVVGATLLRFSPAIAARASWLKHRLFS